jgi:mycofactocin precursor
MEDNKEWRDGVMRLEKNVGYSNAPHIRRGGRRAMEDKKKDPVGPQNDDQEDSIFETEEIKVEEMAIDGICGVY